MLATAAISAALPFFASIAGLIGAISFWPTIVFGPIQTYIAVRSPPPGRRRALQALNVAFGFLAAAAFVGSLYTFAHEARTFRPFGL